MRKFALFVFLGSCLAAGARGAPLQPPKDSYQLDDFDNLEDNLVDDYEYYVPGMYPPKTSAVDYYNMKSELPAAEIPAADPNKYVIDTVNKVLRLKTEDSTAETKLSQEEEEEIKKMSAAFIELFTNAKLENVDWDSQTQTQSPEVEGKTETDPETWRTLNPVITFSKSGLSISFVNSTGQNVTTEAPATSRASDDEGTTEPSGEDELRESLWSYLSDSIDKLLNDELERISNTTETGETTETVYITTEEPEDPETLSKEDQTAVSRFVDSIWNLMRTSVEFVGNLFQGEQGSEAGSADNSTATPEPPTPSTTEGQVKSAAASTIFAYEEAPTAHRFPSQEFEKRGRDIDALLYGHGIV